MVDTARNFGAGSIPEYYDSIMGPAQFERFAADLVRRLSTRPPGDVLEVGRRDHRLATGQEQLDQALSSRRVEL